MNDLNNIPKIELHLHLDGSLNIESVKKRYNLSNDKIKEKMIVNDDCHDLNDYLTKFAFPISVMQTTEELTTSIIELLTELKKQNVIYCEIRFAPQLHTQKGLTQEEVVKTLIDSKNKVDIKSNLILCFLRGKDFKLNNETLEIAKKYYNKGVCAVDIAGSESLYKIDDYKILFDKAKEYNIPFTIHAGEASGVGSIKKAIEFGAKRIGHGVRCIEDENLIKEIKEKNITLEICPTSNIQTGIYKSYKDHPIYELYKKGLKVTINTDNMTVSNTNLSKEYINLINNTNLTINDIINMNINSINSAFLSKEEKKMILNEYINLINKCN